MTKKTIVVIHAVLATTIMLSAAPNQMIGMLSGGPGASSGVQVDGSTVGSSATLFDGSLVSSSNFSRLQLTSGTRVDLGAGTSARIFANHALLEHGNIEVQSNSGYAIEARWLRIQVSTSAAVARVLIGGDQQIRVTAVGAPVEVRNTSGVLVSKVLPEAPMSFLPQAAGANGFSNAGCIANKSGAALFVDSTGNQVSELRSSVKTVDLRKIVGKRAKVTGVIDHSAKATPGAAQVVQVSSIEEAPGGSCSDAISRLGASASAVGLAAGGAAGAAGAAGGAAAGVAAGVTGSAAAAGAGVSAAAIGGIAAASAAAIGTSVAVASVTSTSP